MESKKKRIAELILLSRETDEFSEKRRSELNELLRTKEENREFAAQFLLDGESLTECLATDEISEISARKKHPVVARTKRLSRFTAVASIAATLLLLGLATWAILPSLLDHSPVAVIRDHADAVFSDEDILTARQLDPTQYSLTSGMVMIEFRNGVSLTMKGPADFEIIDEFRIKLSRGQVRAFAPESGHGFTIETPNADLIDLGTEFGVSVDPATEVSEVQVFDGQVDVKNREGKTPISSLRFGDAARIRQGSIESIRAPRPDTFPTPSDLGFARWQILDRKFRADKDVLFYYAFHRSKEDDRTLFDESEHGESIHGKIKGARWVTGRWAGKRALLFDQPGDAVEIEIPGELPQFTFSAWINADRFDHGLTPIFNSAGWEEGDFHLQYSRSRGTIFAAVYPESLKSEDTNSLPVGRWVHLAAVVDVDQGFASTWIDGQRAVHSDLSESAFSKPGLCRLGAWLNEEQDRKWARDREFRGRIDEVVLWKRALSPKEIRKLATKGKP